jgi:hypothetical protein
VKERKGRRGTVVKVGNQLIDLNGGTVVEKGKKAKRSKRRRDALSAPGISG